MSRWDDERRARILGLRMKTFYNADYFDRIVLPLLDVPPGGRVLDVGCGYGGLSLLWAERRPDLRITGVDPEAGILKRAEAIASERRLANLAFEQGDGHQLIYESDRFDAVVCQTMLTHVRDAAAVVAEMARVLKPGGVFMAMEYTELGVPASYNSAENQKRDESWFEKHFRVSRLAIQGKKALGWGDDTVGVRIPVLATAAGLDVFDVRLNDRVLHVIPPYTHPKQQAYAELLKELHKPDASVRQRTIDAACAGGGTEEDGQWLYDATFQPYVGSSIDDQKLTLITAFIFFLTFARRP
jgi:ubiquinone/menaquinone biosynthesis C-methylase UbiE